MPRKDFKIIWEIDIYAGTPEGAVREVIDYLRSEPPSVWSYRVIDKETGQETIIEGNNVSSQKE